MRIRSTVLTCIVALATLAIPPAAADAYIYWASSSGIARADLNGTGVNESFISGATARYVTVDANHIYWANSNEGTIGRANLDGSNVDQSFITGGNYLTGIAVDANHIYWGDLGANTIGRADLDGGNVNQSLISNTFLSPFGVAVNASHVYWASGNYTAIGRADLDGNSPDLTFVDTGNPYGVALDSNRVYWTASNAVGRADLDGTNSTPNFISGADNPLGVATDTDHVYWSNYNANTIGRADLDGSGVNQSFISGIHPNGVAVDALTFPETTITSGPEGLTNDPSPNFAFSSDQPGSTFECRIDSAAFASCASPKVYQGLADGDHSFGVRATNLESATDSTPAERSFTVDTAAPKTKITKKPKSKIKTKKKSAKVKVSFKSEQGAKFKCKLDKGKYKSCSSPYKVKAKSKGGKGKKHTISIKATDKAGNVGKAATVKFKVIKKG